MARVINLYDVAKSVCVLTEISEVAPNQKHSQLYSRLNVPLQRFLL